MTKLITLKNNLDQITTQIKELTKKQTALKEELLEQLDTNIQLALTRKDEPYGVIHVEGCEVNVPKKVTWDQKQLAEIHQNILISNEDPADYIDVAYKVAESKFKVWPTSIRDRFLPARTVEAGNASIKIEKDE